MKSKSKKVERISDTVLLWKLEMYLIEVMGGEALEEDCIALILETRKRILENLGINEVT